MTKDAKERVIWTASAVLLAAWIMAFLANYGLRDFWFTKPEHGASLVQQYAILAYGAVLMFTAVVLAWMFYATGVSDLKKKAEMERGFRRELEDVHRGTLQALTMALDVRDGETLGHSRRVMGFSLAIGEQLALTADESETLAWGALLHDLGKIGIRDHILLKPGPLTAEERAEMQQHVILGFQMVQQIPFLQRTAAVLRHHHERFDGQGYPDQLAGENIPLLARIFAVADAFDAMTSARPYRPTPKSLAEGRAVVLSEAGTQFCPTVVRAFERIPMEQFEAIRAESFSPIGEMAALFQRDQSPVTLAVDLYRDPLTGTHNRTAWEAKQSHMAMAKGRDMGVVVFLDVDGLKLINDNFGHLSGDRMLTDLGARLLQLGMETYRVGGDEFVLWCSADRWSVASEHQVQHALDGFSLQWSNLVPDMAVSWGASIATGETRSLNELLAAADAVMYEFKLRRRSKVANRNVSSA